MHICRKPSLFALPEILLKRARARTVHRCWLSFRNAESDVSKRKSQALKNAHLGMPLQNLTLKNTLSGLCEVECDGLLLLLTGERTREDP